MDEFEEIAGRGLDDDAKAKLGAGAGSLARVIEAEALLETGSLQVQSASVRTVVVWEVDGERREQVVERRWVFAWQ
ncbi:MAG: hypothetical protein HC927_07725 [Deltaproteobacteria bacterium]|nr:hypothetical protein [Deltaproteobacteria bacterium]